MTLEDVQLFVSAVRGRNVNDDLGTSDIGSVFSSVDLQGCTVIVADGMAVFSSPLIARQQKFYNIRTYEMAIVNAQ